MRRFVSFVALVMAALWLPATLRCELEMLPGLEGLSCKSPCKTAAGEGCADGCAALEGGFIKVSNDDVKVSAPFVTDLCAGLACCLCSTLSIPRPATDLVWSAGGDEDARQRTWQFVRRAAPPSRAPAV